MLHPQIVVFERERRIALLLREWAAARRWVLREPRQQSAGWDFLRQDAATVCVIHVPKDCVPAFQLLLNVSNSCPAVAIVAVGEPENAETHAGLAWDLGADFALFPPLSRDLLPDVVFGLMSRAIRKRSSPPVAAGGLEE